MLVRGPTPCHRCKAVLACAFFVGVCVDICIGVFRGGFESFQKSGHVDGRHPRTPKPSRTAPSQIGCTYRGSHATALPKYWVSLLLTFSSSHFCPNSDKGRIKKSEK